jgi:hypothetical protein
MYKSIRWLAGRSDGNHISFIEFDFFLQITRLLDTRFYPNVILQLTSAVTRNISVYEAEM